MSDQTSICATCGQQIMCGRQNWYHSIETQSTWAQAHPAVPVVAE